MFKNILIALAFLSLASAMIQLVLVAFYETLDGGILVSGCIIFGLALMALIYNFVFDASDKGYLLVSLGIGLLLSTLIVKWVDNSNTPQPTTSIEFQIVSIGSSRVKSTEFVYLQLHSPQGKIKYNIDMSEIHKYNVGETLPLDASVGFFGYPTIE